MVGGTHWNQIFVRSVFLERVKLSPRDLHAGYVKALTRSLRETFEGKCTKYGYIKRGSIEVVQVYMGSVEAQTFRGYSNFNVKFKADVCNPAIGAVVVAKVQNINGFGILCTCGYVDETLGGGKYVPILEIITPKHTQSIKSEVDLAAIKVGDEVNVEIMGKKFELMDTKISTIGRIVKRTHVAKKLYEGEEDHEQAQPEGGEDDGAFDLGEEGEFYADSKDGDEDEGDEDDVDEDGEENDNDDDEGGEEDEDAEGGRQSGGGKDKKEKKTETAEEEEEEEEDDAEVEDEDDVDVEEDVEEAEDDFYVE